MWEQREESYILTCACGKVAHARVATSRCIPQKLPATVQADTSADNLIYNAGVNQCTGT